MKICKQNKPDNGHEASEDYIAYRPSTPAQHSHSARMKPGVWQPPPMLSILPLPLPSSQSYLTPPATTIKPSTF